MKRKITQKHFLFYTVEHVIGVFSVFLIAVFVALTAPVSSNAPSIVDRVIPTTPSLHLASVFPSSVNLYWDSASDNVGVVGYKLYKNGKLITSQTLPTFTDATGLIPGSIIAYTVAAVDAAGNFSPPSETAFVSVPTETATNTESPAPAKEVFFTVTPAPVTDCTTGKPMHEVFFAISDIAGGDFLLTSPMNDIVEKHIPWGRQILPNGIYNWKASPLEGYIAASPSSESFVLSGACGESLSVIPGATSDEASKTENAPTVVTNLEHPVLRLFLDNTPIALSDRNFNGERVELRFTLRNVKKVNFYAIKEGVSPPIDLGVGIYDDLLSMKGIDVWATTWETGKMSNGAYTLFARALLLSGDVVETTTIGVVVDDVKEDAALLPAITTEAGQVVTSVSVDTSLPLSLASITDPSLCRDVPSCRAYCEGGAGEREQCLLFTRTLLVASSTPLFVSLADDIPHERLAQLLSDFSHRPLDLPDYVALPDDMITFCRDALHADICTRILERSDLASKATLDEKQLMLSANEATINGLFVARTGARVFIDTDDDHVSDYDEINIYGTNPREADSDGDGFHDGEELVMHSDPTGVRLVADASSTTNDRSLSEEVKLEDPRIAGVTAPGVLSVKNITTQGVGMGSTTSKKIFAFSGTAPENSIVTLFIFSDPISVSTRANASGTWSYVLSKDISDGTHEAILAITDAKGRVLIKSDPTIFVKDALGVVVDASPLLPRESSSTNGPLVAMIALLLAGLGMTFSFAGLLLHRHTLHTPRIILPK